MTVRSIILCGIVLAMLSCSGQNKCTNCGLVISKLKFLDTINHEYVSNQIYWPDHRIWYKDSLVIEEISGIYIKRDTSGQEQRAVEVLHYTFIDLRSRSFYEYITFSDTAKAIKQYIQPDSLGVPGGSVFYVALDVRVTEPVQNMTDTSIDGVAYQRVKFINNAENVVKIGYLRCDKKGTLFQFFKAFSEKRGCPMVRFDDMPTVKYPVSASGQVEFIANSLTSEELKVFAAWERNAKLSPIKTGH